MNSEELVKLEVLPRLIRYLEEQKTIYEKELDRIRAYNGQSKQLLLWMHR